MGEKQNKTAGTAKQNIMAAVAIVVLAIGGYAGYKLNSGNSNRTTQSNPTIEKAEVVQNGNNDQQITDDASAANTTTAAQQTTDNTGGTQPEEIKNALPAENNTTTSAVPAPAENKANEPDSKKEQPATPVKNTATNAENKEDQKVAQEQPSNTSNKANTATVKDKKEDNAQQYDINSARTSTPVQATPVTEPAVIKHETPKKKITDFITVSRLGSSNNSGSVQNVLLSVKNVTDFPIDLAVIDIQYFGTSGRFEKGETMYVRNIGAGNNVNVRIPDSKTSRSITYKVSLVNSEQKTLYLVGD